MEEELRNVHYTQRWRHCDPKCGFWTFPHNLLPACFGKLAATHFLATVGPETNLSGAALVERNTERRTKIVHEITTGAR